MDDFIREYLPAGSPERKAVQGAIVALIVCGGVVARNLWLGYRRQPAARKIGQDQASPAGRNRVSEQKSSLTQD